MKISLSGFILNDTRMRQKLSMILLTDKDQSVPADVALDTLIQEYVNLRLGGTSELVGESKFPACKFSLSIPNDGPAIIQRSKMLSHLDVTMPAPGPYNEEVQQ
jgi:hypothetical protein